MREHRKYYRHPVDVPILVFPLEHKGLQEVPMHDVSEGGLEFQTNVFLSKGVALNVRIPHLKPPFEAEGVVCWCHQVGGRFDVGVMFTEENAAFHARMVEQVCHIEKYREHLLAEKGQRLSFEEAAREWIGKYGADF